MASVDCRAVVLAAGMGTRMNSEIPKVLHPIAGRRMLDWVVSSCHRATGETVAVVVGPELADLESDSRIQWVHQEDRLGTGHATLQTEPFLRSQSDLLLVVNADMALLRSDTLERLIRAQEGHRGPFSLVAARSEEPRAFGRLLRDEAGRLVGIVEEVEATPSQLEIRELNVGAFCFRAEWLWDHLPLLRPSKKGEYYLTDLVRIAAEQGGEIGCVYVGAESESIGINTRVHLAEAEAAMRDRINEKWMLEGVTLQDPDTTYIGPDVQIGRDTLILANTHLEGGTTIGESCVLGPNTIIRDSTIGANCKVEASVVEGAELDEDVRIGPFGHLRKGARLGRGVHMGNFGEVKDSTLGPGVKMGHFAYIGDATIGANVNVGAGTITCNFDGRRKNPTEIGADAFIGSDTMLVAPVRVGRRARTGAGAVVTKDVPEATVAVGMPARVIRRLKDEDE